MNPTDGWPPPTAFYVASLPAFPPEALRGWLRDFVEAEARATQTPPDLAGGLSLAICASACARKIEVRVRDGWVEPVNIYHVTVLPPGNRKSAVFADVVAPLEEFEEAEVSRLGPQIAEAETGRKILEQRLQRAQSDAAKARLSERAALEREALQLARELEVSSVPARPRLIVDDCSPERLATLLRDQGGRMAAMSPEGDTFDLMAGRYSATGDPNLGVYLKGHAVDTIRVDRVGRPPEYVRRPALTIGLAVQPEVVRGLAGKPSFRGRGLLGRFLYALPPSTLGHRDPNPPPMPLGVRAAYRRALFGLLRLPFGTDSEGNPAPHLLRLEPRALECLQSFLEWLEPQLAEFGELGSMTDWAGKLAGHVVRLAGLLHMADHAGETAPWHIPVDGPTLVRAVALGEYFLAHAKAAYSEMGADPEVEAAKYVLAWILRKGVSVFTKRDAFEGTKGRFKRVDALEPALSLLAAHGYIRERSDEKHVGPGRKPSPVYEVNPLAQSRGSQSEPHSANHANSANSGWGDEVSISGVPS